MKKFFITLLMVTMVPFSASSVWAISEEKSHHPLDVDPAEAGIGRYSEDFEDYNEISLGEQNNKNQAPTSRSISESTRIYGNDRFDTAVAISKQTFNKSDNVVLVDGINYPDALAGGPLAYLLDAPILLVNTNSNGINSSTMEEIKRLEAKNIYILGGTGAISTDIEDILNADGYTVERLGGADRYETAQLIANKMLEIEPTIDTAIISSGHTYADALSVGPGASMNKQPILFTDSDYIPESTKEVLSKVEKVNIVGGTGVVSSSVQTSIAKESQVTRLAGNNREATCIAIQKYYFTGQQQTVYVASGYNYPDALAGSVLAAKEGRPILITSLNSVSDETLDYANSNDITTTVALGGVGAVSQNNVKAIEGNLQIKGIDVSMFNEVTDWNKVKADGIEYVIVRVGGRFGASGKLYDDPDFFENIKGASAAGLDVGVYYYTQAINNAEAIEEANYTIEKIKESGVRITMPVVYDTESLSNGRHNNLTDQQRTDAAKAFCSTIEKAGYDAMIYSNLSWLDNNLYMDQLTMYDTWVAHYGYNNGGVSMACAYEGRYHFWQYTSMGLVDGIEGRVDLNLWYPRGKN